MCIAATGGEGFLLVGAVEEIPEIGMAAFVRKAGVEALDHPLGYVAAGSGAAAVMLWNSAHKKKIKHKTKLHVPARRPYKGTVSM